MPAERTFIYRGPDSETLDVKQFSAYLGVSKEILLEMVRKGIIPKPRSLNKRDRAWPWETCLWVRMGVTLGHISTEEDPESMPET